VGVLEEKGWNNKAKKGWQDAEVKKITADNNYELFDKSYDGKEVYSVSFADEENAVVGTTVLLVDPTSKKVIGYLPGE
jgi:hypothetical protein